MHAIVTAWQQSGCGSYWTVGGAINGASWTAMPGVMFNYKHKKIILMKMFQSKAFFKKIKQIQRFQNKN